MTTKNKVLIGIGVAVLLAIIVGTTVFLLSNPSFTAGLRDLAIILVALEMIAIGALLCVLIWQVAMLVRLLRDEIKPMLDATQETVGTVRGTATFVSEQVVTPAIKFSSRVAGWKRSLDVLLGRSN